VAQRNSRPPNNTGEPSALLPVRIQPRASKNEIGLMENGGLKIRLTAPPVDGAANEALIRFLAERLGIAKSRIGIVSGHTGRDKVVRISGVSEAEAKRVLIQGKK